MGEPMKMKMSATSTILPRMAVSVPAYAKINLTLELLGVRPDGYHAIRSVVVPVELHDDVEISVEPLNVTSNTPASPAISLETISDGVSLTALGSADNNLAVRAARLFLDRIGQFEFQISDFKSQNSPSPLTTSFSASAPSAPLRDKNNPAPNRQTVKPSNRKPPFCILHSAFCIRIVKRIPLGGGLGGGSADAAAVLVGLNSLFPEPPFSRAELATMGAEIGSDIPAMVTGGTIMMEGRGEIVTPLRGPDGRSPLPSMVVLLANPGTHVSTAEAYRESNAVLTSSSFSCNILSSPNCVGSASACAAWLFNGLERAVFARHPEVAALAARLREAGGAAVLMSGSGATVFALADDEAEAERLARALPDGCWWTVTRTLPDGVMAAHGPLEA